MKYVQVEKKNCKYEKNHIFTHSFKILINISKGFIKVINKGFIKVYKGYNYKG